jgi:hypothetical protein
MMNCLKFEATVSKEMVEVKVFINDNIRGTITLPLDEWDLIRPMIRCGDQYYLDGECGILVETNGSVPAFMAGIT